MRSDSSARNFTDHSAAGNELPAAARLSVEVQRQVSRLLSPLWVPAVVGMLRFGFGYRIEGAHAVLLDVDHGTYPYAVRRQYQRILRERRGPLLVCANHLTMIDSAIIAWALGSPAWYVRHFAAIPWNLPERRNFAYSPLSDAEAKEK